MAVISFIYPDFENLGIEFLMAACRREKHTVNYIHYNYQDMFFKKNYSPRFNDIAIDVIKKGTQIAAFSCVTDNFRAQLKIAEEIKSERPGIITVFGGVHVTAVPERVLANSAVDCVAIGEAELSLIELLGNLTSVQGGVSLPERAVTGMVFKKEGKMIGLFDHRGAPSDLDALPLLFKEPIYRQIPGSSAEYMTMTSRGCPFSCSYCFNSAGENGLRRRSVENVIDELLIAKKNFSPRGLFFVDDCFTSDREWLDAFCIEYKKHIDIPFSCSTHPLFMNDERASVLKNAGCYNVNIGVQSISQKLCKEVINRKGGEKDIIEAITALKRYGIRVVADHLLGIPGDTVETQERSILFYNEYRPFLVSVYWLCYYPGTKILDIARKMGFLTDDDILKLENGIRVVENRSLLADGDMHHPEKFHSVAFILNWLPFLPGKLVRWLIYSGNYRLFNVKSYYLSVVLPRLLLCLYPGNFRGRYHVLRWLNSFFARFNIPGRILSYRSRRT